MGFDCLCKRRDSVIVNVKYHHIKNISSLIRNKTVKSNIFTSKKLVKLVKLIRNLSFIEYLVFLNIITYYEKFSLTYI